MTSTLSRWSWSAWESGLCPPVRAGPVLCWSRSAHPNPLCDKALPRLIVRQPTLPVWERGLCPSVCAVLKTARKPALPVCPWSVLVLMRRTPALPVWEKGSAPGSVLVLMRRTPALPVWERGHRPVVCAGLGPLPIWERGLCPLVCTPLFYSPPCFSELSVHKSKRGSKRTHPARRCAT